MALGEEFEGTLQAARAGAEWALAALYRDLHPRVLRYLQGQDQTEAEDLASELWIDVATGLDRFAGNESAFHSWVFTIARRRVVDLRRRRSRRRTSAAPVETLREHPSAEDVEASVVHDAAFREAVAGIRTLPPDQADVVLLRVVAGLSVEEVASIMDKRPGTIRVLQHRALKRLALIFSPEPVTERELWRFKGRDATPAP